MNNWLRGWAATLRIMIFQRETYRLLRDYSDREFFEGDFVEVGPPTAIPMRGWAGIRAADAPPHE